MHVHILGICGTFMGGVAALARAAGHRVTGSDENVYPPMSTQLAELGIDIHAGYDDAQFFPKPDRVVVGNALSRGNSAVEAMLDQGLPYQSGPAWLADNVLNGKHVLAVAGTHGKTTTSSILAWILDAAGLEPGFLIGGVPANFGVSARLGGGKYFVVEADEYDTAFFDKRAKFVHYRPRTLVLNNLEFDHADIYSDLAAIQWQFHQLLRTVPASGRIVSNAADPNLAATIDAGCWTPVTSFALDGGAAWRAAFVDQGQRHIRITAPDGRTAEARWAMPGSHNLENALAAVAAANAAGVDFSRAVSALEGFGGVKRRLERTATVSGIAIYDDFAHHPTAIRRTLEGLKRHAPGKRLIVALEPRSNTMKLGHHNATLAASLELAHAVFLYSPPDLEADFRDSLAELGDRLSVETDYDELVNRIAPALASGDQLVFMSNGGFGGARQTLTALLKRLRSE
ncbi:MAG: UDP-N-acetylmuramate:L-alanyl-gamma-D-glutamyl-meso-diaminopimelate ligase [Pseudomonadota bacterium]